MTVIAIVRATCLLFILFSVGCSFVVASDFYAEDDLPRADSDNEPIFSGYVALPARPVRMQARVNSQRPWGTMETTTSGTVRTYAEMPDGEEEGDPGYYWAIRYRLDELKAYMDATNRVAQIRFVTVDADGEDVVLANSIGNAGDCYFGRRSAGDAPLAAAFACATTNGILVRFNAVHPPPIDCPPDVPDCEENIVISREDQPDRWDGQGTGGAGAQ